MATLGLDVGSRRDHVVVPLRESWTLSQLRPLLRSSRRPLFAVNPSSLTSPTWTSLIAVALLLLARVVAQESGSDVVLGKPRGSVLRMLTTLGLAELPADWRGARK